MREYVRIMRIAISLLNLRPGKVGGTETYVRRLISNMAERKGDDEIVLVCYRGNADVVDAPGLRRAVVDRGDRAIVAARILEAFTPYRARFAEKVFDEIQPDVVFFPQQSIFPKHISPPTVMTVVDVQHRLLPHHFSPFMKAFRATAYNRSLRRADRIIAISGYTKKTLTRHCRVDPARVVVVSHGFTPDALGDAAPLDGVSGPYLHYPAATFRHKGHRTLLKTFAKLRSRGDFPYKLVLTGWRTPYWAKLQRQIGALGLGETVVHLGFIPFGQVQRVYASADAIVFPSEFEGFGLPVTEAAQCQRKVIVSRLEVFDEIGVPRRFQIDFSDPDQLLRALQEPGPTVLEKTPLTGDEAAQQTLQLLRQTRPVPGRGDLVC